MARIVHEIVHRNFGENDPETGWYLQRTTVALDKDSHPTRVIDRRPLAKFLNNEITAQTEVLSIESALKDETFVLLPEGWNFADLEKIK